jgi:sugar phosphate isomerase/epimerase
MKHALSTHLFVNHRLTTSWLDRIQRTGVETIEIFCARQHFDYTNRAQMDELAHWFNDSGMAVHSLHAPIYTDDVWGRTGPNAIINITETAKAKRIGMVDEIRRAMEFAEMVPVRYMVQHLGVSHEEYSERKIEAAFSSLDELIVFGKQRGIEVILENIPNALSSAERLLHFLDMTHLNLGFCFDTGHANMNEGVEAAFDLMRDRIRSTHVHDNDGKDDKHVWPFIGDGGTIDWHETMMMFRPCNDQFPLLLELKELPDHKHPIDDMAEIFDRLENS